MGDLLQQGERDRSLPGCSLNITTIYPVFKMIQDPNRRADAILAFKMIARAQTRSNLDKAVRSFERKLGIQLSSTNQSTHVGFPRSGLIWTALAIDLGCSTPTIVGRPGLSSFYEQILGAEQVSAFPK